MKKTRRHDCVFCNVVSGEEFSWKIYEDDSVLAFLDINPASEGHTLVIPKVHFDSIQAIPEELLVRVVRTTKRIAERITEKLGVSEFNIVLASGKSAQQSVSHFHFHLVPRRPNDGIDLWFKVHSPSKSQFAALVKIIEF